MSRERLSILQQKISELKIQKEELLENKQNLLGDPLKEKDKVEQTKVKINNIVHIDLVDTKIREDGKKIRVLKIKRKVKKNREKCEEDANEIINGLNHYF